MKVLKIISTAILAATLTSASFAGGDSCNHLNIIFQNKGTKTWAMENGDVVFHAGTATQHDKILQPHTTGVVNLVADWTKGPDAEITYFNQANPSEKFTLAVSQGYCTVMGKPVNTAVSQGANLISIVDTVNPVLHYGYDSKSGSVTVDIK